VKKLTLEADPAAACSASVLWVSNDRMADRGEVRPDLVRAPGFEPNPEQSGARKPLADLEMGDGVPGPVGPGGHHGPVAAVSADRGVDRAAIRVRMTLHEGGVLARDLARLHHQLERVERLLRAGHDEQPRRVLVEPVHDARSGRQKLREGYPVMARRGMRNDAGGLVHDDEMLVLEDDVERNGGRCIGRFGGGRGRDHDAVAVFNAVVLGPGGPVDRDGAALDRPLGCRARGEGPLGRQERVEAQAGVLL
jgi:hypothetical protein